MNVMPCDRVLTHAIGKKDVLDADIPAFVFLVCTLYVNFWRLWEGIREHELTLSLGKMRSVTPEGHFYILDHTAVGPGE